MSSDPTNGEARGEWAAGPSVAELLSGVGRRSLGDAQVTGELPVRPAAQPSAPQPEPHSRHTSTPEPAVENPVLAAQLAAATGPVLEPSANAPPPDDTRGEMPDAMRDAAAAALRKITRKPAMRTEMPGEAVASKPCGLKRDVRWLAFFTALVNLLLLAMPFHMLLVYERVLASGSGATLFYITALALAALVLLGIAEAVRTMVAQRMSACYVARTAEPLFKGLMQDDAVRADRMVGSNGEPISRGTLLCAFYALRSVLSSRALLSVFDLPFTVLFLLLLFALNVQIGMLTTIGIAVLAGLAWAERKLTADTSADAIRANSEAVSFSQAFVGRAEDIRAMGLFPHVLRRWGVAMGHSITHADDATRINATFFGISRTVRQGLQVLIIAWGAWLVLQGDLSGGMIFAASLISGRAITPVEQVIGAWDRLFQGWRAYREIETFLSGMPEHETAVVPSVTAGDLSVERLGVEVGIGQRNATVLAGVSFTLAAGECLAVVGPSGAGKSTLAKCLSGAVVPTTGSVRLDDFELTRWPDLRRRQSIGYVPQDATLFPGTIADNISGFTSAPDDDAIVAAARAADIHSRIVRLPDGYSTQVGPGSEELSGGQRGQLALARAFYARPRLLVLDEPNAHLDWTAEESLLRTIARLKDEGAAVVVVSQRRSVLKVADRVLTLNEGRVVSLVENRGQWRARHTDARSPAGRSKTEMRVEASPSNRAAGNAMSATPTKGAA